MNRALQNDPKPHKHQAPKSPNLDSLIMDCQSVQRNVQFRKRSFINSYLESQDGIYIPSPPMTAANHGFMPQSKQNVDNILGSNNSEEDFRFDVPLSGELIIDPDASEELDSGRQFANLLEKMELRTEHSKERFLFIV